MQFPIKLRYKMLFYSEEVYEWFEISKLNLQIPSAWDPKGEVSDYQVFTLYVDCEEERSGSIILQHSTDLHYCSNFKYLAKDPFQIPRPDGYLMDNYEIIFFKNRNENDDIKLDLMCFDKQEPNLQQILAFILQDLLYNSRYSQFGIQKQVEDAIETIFYKSIKKIIRFIAKIQSIQYTCLQELVIKVFQNPIFIHDRDVRSIVYKTMLSQGLFPIHCEINTMDDSYIKLKLLSLFTNSEILPWSPKFHASLALANYHYSFTPNDLFNLRTLDQRKFHQGYHYIRLRILDFFPLDQWVELVTDFFLENQKDIFAYIRDGIKQGFQVQRTKSDSVKLKQADDKVISRSLSMNLKEQLLATEPPETELMQDSRNIHSATSVRQLSLSARELDGSELTKYLLKKSLNKITKKKEAYGIVFENPYLVEIKSQISQEFYVNYRYELEQTHLLKHFCSIITETELRKYNTCANNCQTPVAALIYKICDQFRPYQEVLYRKNSFLFNCEKHFHIQNTERGYSFMKSKFVKDDQSSSNEKYKNQMENKSQAAIFEKQLEQYCKYSSNADLYLFHQTFIQPAILEKSLDYFGFFSDQLSSDFLKRIQELDWNPNDFTAKRKSIFSGQPPPNNAIIQDNLFRSIYEAAEQEIVNNYQQYNIDSSKQILDQFLQIANYKTGSQLLETSQLRKPIQTLDIHFLIQHYQNLLLKMKQEQDKNVGYKHLIQNLLDLAYYLYFNSIRIQISLKNNRSYLSYIGFVLVKDYQKIQIPSIQSDNRITFLTSSPIRGSNLKGQF